MSWKRRGLIAPFIVYPAVVSTVWFVSSPPAARSCAASSGTPRSLVAPAILVEDVQFRSKDVMGVFEGVSDFAEWALGTAKLAPGEFPEEALFVLDLSEYYGEIVNGGHPQFVWNSFAREGRLDRSKLDRLERHLGRMGERENQAIIRDLHALLDRSPEVVRWATTGASYSDFPRELQALDDRFHKAERTGELWEKVGRWARSLPTLKPLPRGALQAEMAAIVAASRSRPLPPAAADADGATAAMASSDPCAVAGSEVRGAAEGRAR